MTSNHSTDSDKRISSITEKSCKAQSTTQYAKLVKNRSSTSKTAQEQPSINDTLKTSLRSSPFGAEKYLESQTPFKLKPKANHDKIQLSNSNNNSRSKNVLTCIQNNQQFHLPDQSTINKTINSTDTFANETTIQQSYSNIQLKKFEGSTTNQIMSIEKTQNQINFVSQILSRINLPINFRFQSAPKQVEDQSNNTIKYAQNMGQVGEHQRKKSNIILQPNFYGGMRNSLNNSIIETKRVSFDAQPSSCYQQDIPSFHQLQIDSLSEDDKCLINDIKSIINERQLDTQFTKVLIQVFEQYHQLNQFKDSQLTIDQLQPDKTINEQMINVLSPIRSPGKNLMSSVVSLEKNAVMNSSRKSKNYSQLSSPNKSMTNSCRKQSKEILMKTEYIKQQNDRSNFKKQNKITMLIREKSHVRSGYLENLQRLEAARETITAKVLKNFISVRQPNEDVVKLGISVLYILASIDNQISLTPDQSQLSDHTWDSVVKALSNQGRILFNFKKIKEFTDNNLMSKIYMKFARKFARCLEFHPNTNLSTQTSYLLLKFVKATIDFISYVRKSVRYEKTNTQELNQEIKETLRQLSHSKLNNNSQLFSPIGQMQNQSQSRLRGLDQSHNNLTASHSKNYLQPNYNLQNVSTPKSTQMNSINVSNSNSQQQLVSPLQISKRKSGTYAKPPMKENINAKNSKTKKFNETEQHISSVIQNLDQSRMQMRSKLNSYLQQKSSQTLDCSIKQL